VPVRKDFPRAYPGGSVPRFSPSPPPGVRGGVALSPFRPFGPFCRFSPFPFDIGITHHASLIHQSINFLPSFYPLIFPRAQSHHPNHDLAAAGRRHRTHHIFINRPPPTETFFFHLIDADSGRLPQYGSVLTVESDHPYFERLENLLAEIGFHFSRRAQSTAAFSNNVIVATVPKKPRHDSFELYGRTRIRCSAL